MTAPRPLRLALASLSGAADAKWARAGASEADLALLGGIALDEPSRRAAHQLRDRGREEFLPRDPFDWIDRQLGALADDPIRAGVNVRATEPAPIRRAAEICARHDATLEVNAHCRQPELCAVGCGETLLADTDRLAAMVTAASETGATTSVKLRTEVSGVDLPATARRLAAAGADVLHIDAMDSEGMIALVADAAPEPTLIANNGVRGRATVREYLACGADAVSLGRPSDNEQVRRRVRAALREWVESAADDATAVGTNAEASTVADDTEAGTVTDDTEAGTVADGTEAGTADGVES